MSIAHETRADVYGEALCFRLKAYAELSKPICVQRGEPATHGFVLLSLLPIAATISLIAAIITVLVAIYLVRTRPDSHGDDLRRVTSSITNGPIEKWNASTSIFDADTDNDGVSDFDEIMSGRDPLRYYVPVPMNEFMMIGILVVGSMVPALGVVLLNERMFRRTQSSPRRGTEQELDSEREEE